MKKSFVIGLILIVLVVALLTVQLAGCKDIKEVEGLVSPQNIRYDGTMITWDKATLAECYYVSVNGGEESKTLTNSYQYDAGGAQFTVRISAAVGDFKRTEEKQFTPLATVSEISVGDSGALSWQAVPGATGYLLEINGKTIDGVVATTTYDQLKAGNNVVKVRPIVVDNDSYYSLWSEAKTVRILTAPAKLAYDGSVLSWTAVPGASAYWVDINGQAFSVDQAKFEYDAAGTDFTVTVRALGDHVSVFDSAAVSDQYFYLDPVRNVQVVDGILKWDPSENATGYRIKLNNKEIGTGVTETFYDKLPVGTSVAISVMPIKADGNAFSEWSAEQTVYVLPAPVVSWNSDLTLDGEANNNFVWDGVQSASGYTVRITDYQGIVELFSYPEAQRAFAYAYSAVGTYKVEVKANAGMVGNYVDSAYSRIVAVERLAAPKAIDNRFVISDPNDITKGFTVQYQQVAGAFGYQLYKDGVKVDGAFSTGSQIVETNLIGDTVSTQQQFTYKLVSVGSVKETQKEISVKLDCLSSEALSFDITVRAMPQNLRMEGFFAEWSVVTGSNGYTVDLGGSFVASDINRLDASILNTGMYNIRVCARGDGGTVLASNYTAPVKVSRLRAPSNIRITKGEGEGLLEFDTVENAMGGYEVYLDQSSQALPENAWDNMYQYIRTEGTVLHMLAVANEYNAEKTVYYMTSPASPTQQFIRLAAPQFPDGAFSNNVELIWNASSNINTQEYTPTYEVYESGVQQQGQQNATRFNIEYLEGGAEYVFTVKAIGNATKYLDSPMSDVIRIKKLAAPEFYIGDNAYHWKSVPDAQGYALYIDGVRVIDQIHVASNIYSFKPSYTTIGKHTVKVYALGDGGKTTVNSPATEYIQNVKILSAPAIRYAYTHNAVTVGGGIEVNITTPSAYANGYVYEIAGFTEWSTENAFCKTIESPGEYLIRVKAKGGLFDDENNFYIDSVYVGGNDGYKIVLLAPPSISSFSINADGAIKWAAINGARGYTYQIAFDNGEFSEFRHSATASLDPIADFRNYRTIRIKVSVNGDGNNIISSMPIEWRWNNPAIA